MALTTVFFIPLLMLLKAVEKWKVFCGWRAGWWSLGVNGCIRPSIEADHQVSTTNDFPPFFNLWIRVTRPSAHPNSLLLCRKPYSIQVLFPYKFPTSLAKTPGSECHHIPGWVFGKGLYIRCRVNASKLSWQKFIFMRESFSEKIILKTLKSDGINSVKIEL